MLDDSAPVVPVFERVEAAWVAFMESVEAALPHFARLAETHKELKDARAAKTQYLTEQMRKHEAR